MYFDITKILTRITAIRKAQDTKKSVERRRRVSARMIWEVMSTASTIKASGRTREASETPELSRKSLTENDQEDWNHLPLATSTLHGVMCNEAEQVSLSKCPQDTSALLLVSQAVHCKPT